MINSKSILLAVVLGTASVASAQNENTPNKSYVDQMHDSIVASQKVVFIGESSPRKKSQAYQDSIDALINKFYVDQFRHFQDPEAPYFLFMSRDAQLAMGIGGTVRMRGYYDWGGAMPSSGFAPYLIPMDPDPTQMRHFDTTPAGTCLFFRVLGRNKTVANYSLYIEANFNGYGGRDFHLKKAYATINDFTIGYASSTFSDPAAVPATVDAQGPNNKLSNTAVLVRWMPRVKKHWVFAVSAETPNTSIDVDNKSTAKVDTWLPDAAAFVQYEWGRTSHIRLSGIVRSLPYRDLISKKNHNIAGWGMQLSGIGHPLPPLTVYATANYGHGYAGLGGDLLIGAYDLTPYTDHPGELYAPASYGWNIGLQYNFRPNLFTSVSLSENRFLPAHSVAPTEYRYGIFGDVNVFWNITPRIQAGAEFDFGKRKDFNGDSRWAKRVGMMAQFSF